MNGLTMKHLRYFVALARHGHFGRAAETCGISQPALSVQIKELEALLGAPLIERGARQIRLSGLGEELAERAKEILRAVDELNDLARAAQGPRLRFRAPGPSQPYGGTLPNTPPPTIKQNQPTFTATTLSRDFQTRHVCRDDICALLDLWFAV